MLMTKAKIQSEPGRHIRRKTRHAKSACLRLRLLPATSIQHGFGPHLDSKAIVLTIGKHVFLAYA